jgi:NAD(P)-dependent dehydrogenase (short-subunit alcohol dehydrogenase family)
MKMNGSTAFVTGANRGIGHHFATQLLARGATVYAGARNPDAIEIPGAKAIALDITDPKSVAAAVEVASDVTLLINNAGLSTSTDLLGNMDMIRLEMETHFFGSLSVTRAFVPVIAANGGGSILNMLSVVSWYSNPASAAYCAAKSAEWSMTNALRLQLVEKNIRVLGLHVGLVDTDLVAQVTAPKSDPALIATMALDGIEQDKYEILADDLSHQIQARLAGGVSALYPQLL